MQYTGLKDKNGVEIYEGDIIECKTDIYNLIHIGEVVFKKEFAAFVIENICGETLFHHLSLNTFKVIGNIYENPELYKLEK